MAVEKMQNCQGNSVGNSEQEYLSWALFRASELNIVTNMF